MGIIGVSRFLRGVIKSLEYRDLFTRGAVRRLDSVSTENSGKRINGFLEMVTIGNQQRIDGRAFVIFRADIDTSDGLVESLSVANLGNLLGGGVFAIVTEEGEMGKACNYHLANDKLYFRGNSAGGEFTR